MSRVINYEWVGNRDQYIPSMVFQAITMFIGQIWVDIVVYVETFLLRPNKFLSKYIRTKMAGLRVWPPCPDPEEAAFSHKKLLASGGIAPLHHPTPPPPPSLTPYAHPVPLTLTDRLVGHH